MRMNLFYIAILGLLLFEGISTDRDEWIVAMFIFIYIDKKFEAISSKLEELEREQ